MRKSSRRWEKTDLSAELVDHLQTMLGLGMRNSVHHPQVMAAIDCCPDVYTLSLGDPRCADLVDILARFERVPRGGYSRSSGRSNNIHEPERGFEVLSFTPAFD